MAKKKAAKKSGRAKPAKTSKRRASKPAAKRKPGPRSQVLPGMEQVRDARLDSLCEAIAEDRRTMNQARVDEQGSIQAALKQMQERETTVYRHGGIELARMPGAEKLRVRVTKEEGDADASDLVPPDPDGDLKSDGEQPF